MSKGQIKQVQNNINKKQFENLCAIQCTKNEICSVLDIDDNTLLDWCKNTYGCDFRTIFKEKRQIGKASLRRTQWKLAEKNTSMAIFLGKNYLGQSDSPESDELKQKELSKVEELLNKLNEEANK